MKKVIIFALIGVLALGLLAGCSSDKEDWDYIKGKGKLIIGITLYEPMNYNDENGKLTGFDTEFAEAACAKLGIKPEFQVIDWEQKENELKSKVYRLYLERIDRNRGKTRKHGFLHIVHIKQTGCRH